MSIPTHKKNKFEVNGHIDLTQEGSLAQASQNFFERAEHTQAFLSSRTRNFEGLVSSPPTDSRPGLRWSDYDAYRPEEAVPSKYEDIITSCNNAYKQVGLIRNVIDLMGDFACQGIRVVHPNKRIEKFHETWWEKVNGKHTSERFLNYLFRLANVIIRMKTAKINAKRRENMMRSIGADMDIIDEKNFSKAEIPYHFTFLDPRSVDVVGGPLANFVGFKQYFLKIPSSLKKFLMQARGKPEFNTLVSQLPNEIRQAIENTGKSIPLPADRTFVYHYKRDDWDAWALPIVYACLDDIMTLRKLKLADRAALDGATSKIRVWKLGSLDHKLYPSAAAADTLASILGNNVGGGTIDITWDPAIDLLETDTDVHSFLGEEKYKPTFMNIYACLGIPPTLTGTFGAAGTTNNLISLKTLTERLKYARGVLCGFWKSQLQIVQESMGFRFPAQLEFDFMNLDDPSTTNQLLINLADRAIISDEFVQRHIGANNDMERIRLKREADDRNKGKMGPKASPYHDPDKEHILKRVFAQTGAVTPSEVGIELEKKKKGEKTALEQRVPKVGGAVPNNNTRKTSPGQRGRPPGSRDSAPRKPVRFTPKTRAQLSLWAQKAQDRIAELLNPGFLQTFGRKNMRSLTREEFDLTERVKFEVLCALEPFSEVEYNFFSFNSSGVNEEFSEWYSQEMPIEEIRKLRTDFYVFYWENLDGDSNDRN